MDGGDKPPTSWKSNGLPVTLIIYKLKLLIGYLYIPEDTGKLQNVWTWQLLISNIPFKWPTASLEYLLRVSPNDESSSGWFNSLLIYIPPTLLVFTNLLSFIIILSLVIIPNHSLPEAVIINISSHGCFQRSWTLAHSWHLILTAEDK